MYGAEFAEVYDLLYGSRKDYAAEAAAIAGLVRTRLPEARSLLDVGCGTGEHLRHWSQRFDDVAGVEGSAGMIGVARRKLPATRIEHADMRVFDLGRTFDVVCSMYGCVGYLPGLPDLHDALARMAAHARPGGLVLFEPWICREDWTGGIDVDDLTVHGERRLARMGNFVTEVTKGTEVTKDIEGTEGSKGTETSQDTEVTKGTEVTKDIEGTEGSKGTEGTEVTKVTIDLHYLYGDAGAVRHFVDSQRLSLFTADDYFSAAKSALDDVEFLAESPSGRGIFLGTPRR